MFRNALMGKQEGGVNRSHYIRDNTSYLLINANKHSVICQSWNMIKSYISYYPVCFINSSLLSCYKL